MTEKYVFYAVFVAFTLLQRSTNGQSVDDKVTVHTKAGSKANLPCCPTSKQQNVQWLLHVNSSLSNTRQIAIDGTVTVDDQRFALKNTPYCYNLVITNVSTSDSGLFSCREDNGSGVQHYVQLNVTAGVTVANVSGMAAKLGTSAILQCPNSQQSTTRWKIFSVSSTDGKQEFIDVIIDNDRVYIDLSSPNKYSLVINKAKQTDTGLYMCQQVTAETETTQYLYLVVADFPDVAAWRSATITLIVLMAVAIAIAIVIVIFLLRRGRKRRVKRRKDRKSLIDSNESTNSPWKSSSKPLQLQRTLFAPDVDIYSFAILGNTLILIRRSKVLQGYSLNKTCDTSLLYETRVDELKDLSSFAVCQISNCCYMGDAVDERLWRLSLPNGTGPQTMIQWYRFKQETDYAQSIASLTLGDVAVLVVNKQVPTGHRIDILSQDAILRKNVMLSTNVDRPISIACSGKGLLTMTYGLYDNGIVQFDLDGNTKSRVTKNISLPACVRYDSKTDKLYVADSGNHRILRFKSDLDMKEGEVVNKWKADENNADDHRPTALEIGNINGGSQQQVIVGMRSGRIELYACT